MPYLLISDDEPGHPQIAPLSDRAVRVHLAGRCHCARYLTDGLIADARTLHRYSPASVAELVAAGLWRSLRGHRYEIVDYLANQRSRAQVERDRAHKTERQAKWRRNTVDGAVVAHVDASTSASVDGAVEPAQALSRYRSQRRENKPSPQQLPSSHPDLSRFLDGYRERYERIVGGKLPADRQDAEIAAKLLETWPLERLLQMAELFFYRDDAEVEGIPRGLPFFKPVASWCDARLTKGGIRAQACCTGRHKPRCPDDVTCTNLRRQEARLKNQIDSDAAEAAERQAAAR